VTAAWPDLAAGGSVGAGDPLAGVTVERLRRRTGRKWSRYGDDVVPAWIADADCDPPPVAVAAIEALLERGDLTYPHDDYPRWIAEAFAARMRDRYGWSPDPDGVVVVTDLVQAVSLIVDHLSEPGDGVAIQTPCYPPFLEEIAALERQVVPSAWIRTDRGWEPDLDHLAEFAAQRPGGVVLLVNPHNPTGRAWRRDELEELAGIALDRRLVVVSDEIHAELTYDDHEHVPFASLDPNLAERTITLTSTSKSFNLPGLRTAVMHLGDGAALEPVRRIRRTQIGTTSTPGMAATLAVWRDGETWLEDFRSGLAARRDELTAMLDEHLPEIRWVRPEATSLAWLDCSALQLDDPGQFFLERALVALSPGHEFGPGGAGHVRLNFATGPSVLSEIVERMVTALDLHRSAP
jgi:cystathionine beta-lyase